MQIICRYFEIFLLLLCCFRIHSISDFYTILETLSCREIKMIIMKQPTSNFFLQTWRKGNGLKTTLLMYSKLNRSLLSLPTDGTGTARTKLTKSLSCPPEVRIILWWQKRGNNLLHMAIWSEDVDKALRQHQRPNKSCNSSIIYRISRSYDNVPRTGCPCSKWNLRDIRQCLWKRG